MAKAKSTKTKSTPVKQAAKPDKPKGAGRGGTVPPAAHRFKPGQSGNPDGRPTAGATMREWLNQLAGKNLTEKQLRRISRDKSLPVLKRTAAERLLRTCEAGDLADFEEALEGTKTLKQLRKMGVNTELVKKMKVRTESSDEEGNTVLSREIELRDRSAEECDRIFDRTEGRPKQEVVAHVDGAIRNPIEGTDQAAGLLAAIRRRLQIDP